MGGGSDNSLQTGEVVGDPRWVSVSARDYRADGRFVYAVSTTSIYCRPSCPARRPKPAHVRFFHTSVAAEREGFRPCRRCRPNALSLREQRLQCVTEVCRAIEAADEIPPLAVLAAAAGLSPSYFHRLFRRAIGVTPRGYAVAVRAQRMQTELGRSRTITDAILNAGYASTGRFYEQAPARLGMTPTRFRAGGRAVTMHYAVGACSLGSVLVARSRRGVCAILLGDDAVELLADLRRRFPRADLLPGDRAFGALVQDVVEMVEAPAVGKSLPLDIRGTAFQQRVWEALRAVPPGRTISYQELARRIGAPRATRAVAGACAANPLAVAIPCHRVVRGNGALAGYRWGLARKQALLKREGV